MTINQGRVVRLVVLSSLTVALVAAFSFTAVAQAPVTVKRFKLKIDCKVTRGASASPCRGTFRISGGFSDSGRLSASISDDRSRNGAGLKATLIGRRGRVDIADDGIRLSHKQRNCLYVSGISFRNGTRIYEGYRGGTVRPGCLSLRITRRVGASHPDRDDSGREARLTASAQV